MFVLADLDGWKSAVASRNTIICFFVEIALQSLAMSLFEYSCLRRCGPCSGALCWHCGQLLFAAPRCKEAAGSWAPDIIIHSATKYIEWARVAAWVVSCGRANTCRKWLFFCGPLARTCSPFNAWYSSRVWKPCACACRHTVPVQQILAEWLEQRTGS